MACAAAAGTCTRCPCLRNFSLPRAASSSSSPSPSFFHFRRSSLLSSRHGLTVCYSSSPFRRLNRNSGFKGTTLVQFELVEVIAALQRGEDVERTLAPWAEKLMLKEWNRIVARVGDSDWDLALRIFNVVKRESAFAGQIISLRDEAAEERRLIVLKAFTSVGAVLARHGREMEVETLIAEMKSLGVDPDAHFFNALVRGYGNQGLVQLASQVLIQMDRHGVKPNNTTYDRVVATYLAGEKPQVDKALLLLKGVRASKITLAYKTLSDLITVCWMANKAEEAVDLFQDMRAADYSIDAKVWMKLMHLHAKGGRFEVVESLFQQMREAGVEAKGGAFDALLLSYCQAGKTDQALSVFREYKLNMKPSLVAFNKIIHETGKAGRHEEAVQLYVDLMESGHRPNSVTYTSLIAAVAQAGRFEKAGELYRRMLDDRLEPTAHTYATVIHACAQRGWTKYGHEICLAAKTGLVNSIVYGAMLHLYVRGRWYSHAAAVLGEMGLNGVEPDVAGYGTLTSACGEQDDRAFTPLAKAMECSEFEPCRMAYRLVCVPPVSGTVDSEHTPSPDDRSGDTACSGLLGADTALQEASAFFKNFALSRGVEFNASFYNALLDALWARHSRSRAKYVFMQARELLEDYARPQYNEEVWSLDLRSLSKGASQVALLHWLEEVAERAATCPVVAPRLRLITGGNMKSISVLKPYSGRGKGVGVVKEVVEEVLKALGVPFTEISRESGPAQLQAQTEQVVRWVTMYKDLLQLSNIPSS